MQLSSGSSDGMRLYRHAGTEPSSSSREVGADDSPNTEEQPQQPRSELTDPFFIGATLSRRYRIESLLMTDEYSLIYRARDLRWDLAEICTDVAIKVFRPELRMQPQWVARLKREFYQTRLIKHRNIVRMHGLDCHEGVWFIAMELLKGAPLSTQLRPLSAPLPQQRSATILSACFDALEFAHERRISHGDLKPSNVFLLNSGGIRILGFGTASSFAAPAIGKAKNLALPPPSVDSTDVENLLPKLPDTHNDALGLANLARELLAAAAIPRIQNEARGSNTLEHAQSKSAHQSLAKPSSTAAPQKTAPAAGPSEMTVIASVNKHAETLPVASEPSKPTVMAPIASTTNPESIRQESTPELRTDFIRARDPAAPVLWKTAGAVLILGAIGWTISHHRDAEPEKIASFISQQEPQRSTRIPANAQPSPAVLEAQPSGITAPAVDQTDKPPKPASKLASNIDNDPASAAHLPAQEISFGANALTVSARASAAVLTLKRSNGREGRLRVDWKIIPGTAVAGRDFSGPTAGSLVFADWQIVKALYIPLVTTHLDEDSSVKTFVVVMTDVSDRARITPIDRVAVDIRRF